MNVALTKEQEQKVLDLGDLLRNLNRSYTPAEIKSVYDLYNSIYGTNKQVSGCGSCRRSVLAPLHVILKQLEDRKQ